MRAQRAALTAERAVVAGVDGGRASAGQEQVAHGAAGGAGSAESVLFAPLLLKTDMSAGTV